jgi:hypothetical protein
MYAWSSDGRLKHYSTTAEIFLEHARIRFKLYGTRKQRLLETLEQKVNKLNEQRRFIELVLSGEVLLLQQKEEDVVKNLQCRGFQDCDGLLRLPTRSLTSTEVTKLTQTLEATSQQLEDLRKRSVGQFWAEDLVALEAAHKTYVADWQDTHVSDILTGTTPGKKGTKRRRPSNEVGLDG